MIRAADRLAACDQNAFLGSWFSSLALDPIPPSILVRSVTALRLSGRIADARAMMSSARSPSTGFRPEEAAKLENERAWFGMLDGNYASARRHLATGIGAAVAGAKTGAAELLQLYCTQARLELAAGDFGLSGRALEHARHLGRGLSPNGGVRGAEIESIGGYLELQLGHPLQAYEGLTAAGEMAPPRSRSAATVGMWRALASAALGRFEEARAQVGASIEIAQAVGGAPALVEAYDCLGFVEYLADSPEAALQAFDEARLLVDSETPRTLSFVVHAHVSLALALLGSTRAAERAQEQAAMLRSELDDVEQIWNNLWAHSRAELAEAKGEHQIVLDLLEHRGESTVVMGRGETLLLCARAHLALGRPQEARTLAVRACALGQETGLVFSGRRRNLALWSLALEAHDSRAVRYAHRMLDQLASSGALRDRPASPELTDRTSLLTTRSGVAVVSPEEARTAAEDAVLVVDLIEHKLRAGSRTISLSRHRALEPLLAELLRRAHQGLTAHQILNSAGGPGPDSSDARHRVRVLVSRMRAFLGDDAPLLTKRKGDGSGRASIYWLASHVTYALIEPGAAPEMSALGRRARELGCPPESGNFPRS